MKRIKNLSHLSLAGLILVAGVACKQESHKPVHTSGPSETGGGNVSRHKLVGVEEDLKGAILLHHSLIENYVRAYQESAENTSDYIKENPDEAIFQLYGKLDGDLPKILNTKMYLQVAEKTKNGKTLMDAAKKLQQPIIYTDKACEDTHGNQMEGSAKYEGRLCFSTLLMAKTSSLIDYHNSIRSLLMHELAHKAGLNEKEAKHIEVLFNFLGDKVEFIDGSRNGLSAGIFNFLSETNSILQSFESDSFNYNNRLESFKYFLERQPLVGVIQRINVKEEKEQEISQAEKEEFISQIKAYLRNFFLGRNGEWLLQITPKDAAEYIYLSILHEKTHHLPRVPYALSNLLDTNMSLHREAEIRMNNDDYKFHSETHDIISQLYDADEKHFYKYLRMSRDTYSLSEKMDQDIRSLAFINRIVGDIFYYWDKAGSRNLNLTPEGYQVCTESSFANDHSENAFIGLKASFCQHFPFVSFEKYTRVSFLQEVVKWYEKELRPIEAQLRKETFFESVYDCISSTEKECEKNYEPSEQEYGKRVVEKAKELRALPVIPSLLMTLEKEIPNRK